MTTIKEQVCREARALLSMESAVTTNRERVPGRRGMVLYVTASFFVPDEARGAAWNEIPLHDVVTTACDDMYMRLIPVLKQSLPKALGDRDA